MSNFTTLRLKKELRELEENPPDGVYLDEVTDLKCWTINIIGAKGTLYEGEIFTLKFSFDSNYPYDSPEVIFINEVPIHPHIYSNGHICLSILYDNWSPALTVSSICVSILSMLSSCTKKVRPLNDANHVMYGYSNPKLSNWAFDDDTC